MVSHPAEITTAVDSPVEAVSSGSSSKGQKKVALAPLEGDGFSDSDDGGNPSISTAERIRLSIKKNPRRSKQLDPASISTQTIESLKLNYHPISMDMQPIEQNELPGAVTEKAVLDEGWYAKFYNHIGLNLLKQVMII